MSTATKKPQEGPPSKEQLYLGGKETCPEFTVFLNIAFKRMSEQIQEIMGDGGGPESTVGNWIQGDGGNDKLDQDHYLKLKNFLWKGYEKDKNSSGTLITDGEKQTAKDLVRKLKELRNYHSHMWYSNEALVFDERTAYILERLHREALEAVIRERGVGAIKTYQGNLCPELDMGGENYGKERNRAPKKTRFFSEHDGNLYITGDGRTFFLSLFLTQGEMERFLDQRRGFKRADGPEFRAKREVFSHYCHRDGATRRFLDNEDSPMDELPRDVAEKLRKTRNVYKTINYLNDVPPTSNDPDTFPIYLKNGERAESAEDLITFVREQGLLKDLELAKLEEPIIKEGGPNTRDRTFTKERIGILDGEGDDLQITISPSAFHRALLDAIRCENGEEWLEGKVRQFLGDRRQLLETVKKGVSERDLRKAFDEREILEEVYRFRERSPKVLEKIEKLWGQIESGGNGVERARGTLEKVAEKNPIPIGYHALYFEEKEKPRAEDRFVEFAVKYLIDLGIVKEWCWMFERFETDMKSGKNERKKEFMRDWPQDDQHRLAVRDGQVLAGVYQKGSGDRPDRLFQLGHRALKNLLIAYLRGSDISHFLHQIGGELNKIEKGEAPNILSEKDLPERLRRSSPLTEDELRERMKMRIETVKERLDDARESKDRMSRDDKNRQVMRCYRYFDWHYPGSDEQKFLRRDEYQSISVLHYCLEMIPEGTKPWDSKSYSFLLEGIKERIPKEINEVLATASDLDDLLEGIVQVTKEKLSEWKGEMKGMDLEQLKVLAGKLGVPTGVKGEDNSHIPFSVHPSLPLRVLLPDEIGEENGPVKWLREQSGQTDGLRMEHYSLEGYFEKVLPNIPEDEAKKVRKKAIGRMNEALTEDAVLWGVVKEAFQYLDEGWRKAFQSEYEGHTSLSVHNLWDEVVRIPVEGISGVSENKVLLFTKFHNLDDHLFLLGSDRLRKAVTQCMDRREKDNGENDHSFQRDTESGLPIVTFDEVRLVLQQVYGRSVHWAGRILEWEKSVIYGIPEAERGEKMVFMDVLDRIELNPDLRVKLERVRNKTFHADIPEGWSLDEMEADEKLQNLFGFEDERQISEQA